MQSFLQSCMFLEFTDFLLQPNLVHGTQVSKPESLHKFVCLIQRISSAIFFTMISGWGSTAGAHRLWCHKSYKANRKLKVLLLTFQTITMQVLQSSKNKKICEEKAFYMISTLRRIFLLFYPVQQNFFLLFKQLFVITFILSPIFQNPTQQFKVFFHTSMNIYIVSF